MNAVFYTFSKRINSTIKPAGSGTTMSIVLKDDCSIVSPVIIVDTNNPTAYNYLYIATFSRYYFIKDWTYIGGRWMATCDVDVLASFASDIKSSAQYVLRCSTESDGDIVDGMYPMTTEVDFGTYEFPTRPVGTTLRYILAISNGVSGHKVGGCTYYNLSYGEFSYVMNKMLGSSSYLGDFSLDGISDSLVKALVNPLQYVGETYILPYDIGGQTQDLLTAGWWPIDNEYGYRVLTNQNILSKHEIWRKDNVSLPLHPQSSQGSYLNCSPYTIYTLYAGPFGSIQLDATLLHNCSRLDLVVNGDFKGNIELEIWGWTMTDGSLTAKLIDKRNTNCAIPISLTQINNNPSAGLSLLGNIGGAVQTAATANPVGLAANIANGFKSAEEYFIPKSEGKPSVGTFDDILEDWLIVGEFRHITQRAPNILGSPLCQDKIISEIQGYPYIKCSNGHIEINGTKDEQERIISYLNEGMYIDV